MTKPARFKVDPKLAALLGEGYRSSEDALKELVDNAWDADAETVRITLPGELTPDPIIIEDDGTGMTELEVRNEYLMVASDRRTRKGELTPVKRRPVKGRKGIGKFAGLLAAQTMAIETCARGKLTRLQITKANFQQNGADFEEINLPIQVQECEGGRGTKIILTGLNNSLAFPSADRLKQILVLEYNRQEGFAIFVNGDRVDIEDIPGTTVNETAVIDGVGWVRIRFTIGEGKKSLKQHGIAFRIGGKIVGRPTMLGLEDDESLPPKLLKRVYGEIEADGLANEVTADWGAIVENSKGFRSVRNWAAGQLKASLETVCAKEVNLARARLKQEVNRRLAQLPEHRRRFADAAVQRILRKFYGESNERVDAVVSVALEAFESEEYWIVVQNIDDATRADVAKLAEVLGELGLADVAVVAQQTHRRLALLDELDRLIGNPATLESQLHTAIEKNLWVLGPDFALVSSNKTLAHMISNWASKAFVGPRANKRPDLFLAQDIRQRYVLVEFKRPSRRITRDDETQAIKYRDDLSPFLPNTPIHVLVVGGPRDQAVSPMYETQALTVTTYYDLVASARADLNWLVSQLE